MTAKTRRSFSKKFKAKVVAQVQGGEVIQQVADRHKIAHSVVRNWIKKAEAGEPSAKGVVVAPQANGHDPLAELQHANRAATIILRKAKSDLLAGIRSGKVNDLDPLHGLVVLALDALQGG